MKTKYLAACLAALLLFSCPAAMAKIESSVGVEDVYVPNAYEPNPYIVGNVTIVNYLNTSDTNLGYEDDGGDQVVVPGEIQKVYLDPTQIVSPTGLQGPVSDGNVNGTKWLTASNWATSEGYASYPSAPTVTEVTVNGVKMLKLAIEGNVSDSNSMGIFKLALNDFDVEVNKTYLAMGIQVVDGAATSDSSYSYMSIAGLLDGGSSMCNYNLGSHNTRQQDIVFSLDTDDKYFLQLKLGEKSVGVCVDGNLTHLQINLMDVVNGSDAMSIYLFALWLEDKQYAFGNLNDVTVFEMDEDASGLIVLDEFSPSFPYEKVTSFGPVQFKMSAADLPAKQTTVRYEELSDTQKADYTRDYAVKEYFNFTFVLPQAIDLSYGPATLYDIPAISTAQYTYVSTKSGTVDAVQVTSEYTGARLGDKITLLSDLTEGTDYVHTIELLLTQAQWEGISEEVGALTSDSTAWWNEWWLWFASLLGIGYGVKRKRNIGGSV